MRAYKLLAMLTVCSLITFQGLFAQSSDRKQTVTVVQAELLPAQTLPIQVSTAKLQNFDTGSELLIDLKKAQEARPSRVVVDVFVSHQGSMKHGEGIPVDLRGIAPEEMSFRLQTLVHLVPGDTALVFVGEVQESEGVKRIPVTDVIQFAKNFVNGQYGGNTVGQTFQPFQVPQSGATAMLKPASISALKLARNLELPVPCLDALAAARATCTNGIASFSCNPSNGQFSFGCK